MSTISESPSARTIAGFMGFAMIFSIVGAEIRSIHPAKGAKPTGALFTEPVLIFLGGTVATAILVLIADTGDSARQVAVAFAGLSLLTAALVNGGPVWSALGSTFGAKSTGSTGTTGTTPVTTSSGG